DVQLVVEGGDPDNPSRRFARLPTERRQFDFLLARGGLVDGALEHGCDCSRRRSAARRGVGRADLPRGTLRPIRGESARLVAARQRRTDRALRPWSGDPRGWLDGAAAPRSAGRPLACVGRGRIRRRRTRGAAERARLLRGNPGLANLLLVVVIVSP